MNKNACSHSTISPNCRPTLREQQGRPGTRWEKNKRKNKKESSKKKLERFFGGNKKALPPRQKKNKKRKTKNEPERPASWKRSQIMVKCSFLICAFSPLFRLVTVWHAWWLLIQVHETAHTLCGSPRLGSGQLTTGVGRVDLDGCAGRRGTAHTESLDATD